MPFAGSSSYVSCFAVARLTTRIYAGVLEGHEQTARTLVEGVFGESGDHEVTTEDAVDTEGALKPA